MSIVNTSPIWNPYWDTEGCVRKVIVQEKERVSKRSGNHIHGNSRLLWSLEDVNFFNILVNINIITFQIQRIFAGYLASVNETSRLVDFFGTIPKVMESRIALSEWKLVIDLSNEIFRVSKLYISICFLHFNEFNHTKLELSY